MALSSADFHPEEEKQSIIGYHQARRKGKPAPTQLGTPEANVTSVQETQEKPHLTYPDFSTRHIYW